MTAVKDTANMTNKKTLKNFGGSFPPAVLGGECEDESRQHLGQTLSTGFEGLSLFLQKHKQATQCWVTDRHCHGWEAVSPLLICVIVSITYQEELLIHPWLPCQQESILCRQVALDLRRWHLSRIRAGKAACHTPSVHNRTVSPTTDKMLQQMDVTVWSARRGLQRDECIMQKRMDDSSAAGRWTVFDMKPPTPAETVAVQKWSIDGPRDGTLRVHSSLSSGHTRVWWPWITTHTQSIVVFHYWKKIFGP